MMKRKNFNLTEPPPRVRLAACWKISLDWGVSLAKAYDTWFNAAECLDKNKKVDEAVAAGLTSFNGIQYLKELKRSHSN